jgi:4-hydroxy-3-methylbut-2-enyl diphosphate reductase
MLISLKKNGLSRKVKSGVTAGASAPEILIKQVIQRLQDWGATS